MRKASNISRESVLSAVKKTSTAGFFSKSPFKEARVRSGLSSSSSIHTTSTVVGPPDSLMRKALWDTSNSSKFRRTDSFRHSSQTVTNPDMRSDPPLKNSLDKPGNAAQGTEVPPAPLSIRYLPTGHNGINDLSRGALHVPDTGRCEANSQYTGVGVGTIQVRVYRNRHIPT